MLKNATLDAKISFDPAENEPPKECCAVATSSFLGVTVYLAVVAAWFFFALPTPVLRLLFQFHTRVGIELAPPSDRTLLYDVDRFHIATLLRARTPDSLE